MSRWKLQKSNLGFEEIDDDRQRRMTCHFLNVDEDYTKASGEVLRGQGVP